MTRIPKFVALVFTLSIPIWVIGGMTGLELLPGLPLASTMWVCPVTAASILVYREGKFAGVKELLRRTLDYGRIRSKVWFLPIILLMPAVMILSYGIMRLVGRPLPTPRVPVLTAFLLFVGFFVAGAGEELGWSGYVIDLMQARWNALQASILLGSVWAIWHIVPLLQAHRAPAWIAWWCLSTVSLRVLIVWLYNNAGKSVFAATLFHDMSNVTWQLFPDSGSHYDPRVTAPILALAALIVTIIWGPRTLGRDDSPGAVTAASRAGP